MQTKICSFFFSTKFKIQVNVVFYEPEKFQELPLNIKKHPSEVTSIAQTVFRLQTVAERYS